MGGIAGRGVYGLGMAGGRRWSHCFDLVMFVDLVLWWVGMGQNGSARWVGVVRSRVVALGGLILS
jgi:hypothetical protein